MFSRDIHDLNQEVDVVVDISINKAPETLMRPGCADRAGRCLVDVSIVTFTACYLAWLC
jgi:hypothetical protein